MAMTSKSNDAARPWFPAKRYGWGWGLPITWQGWVVLAAFVALLLLGAIVLLPNQKQLTFVAYSFVLALLLVAICWVKGERPKWRWGDK
jgi:lipoprotein signal peptidase